jgi:membrane fusion protein, copper/silver efflux system
MKTLKILSVFILTLILTSVKAQQSESGQPGKINPEFQKQLGFVVQSAGELSNIFAADNAANIDVAVKKVKEAISATDMHLLSGQDHMTWMKYMTGMNKQISNMMASSDLSTKRTSFASFNVLLYESVKTFGIKDGISYYQFCPMALDNQGAYWFSNVKDIKNPYMGAMMPTCGSTMEVLK